ncbi:alpha/beta-hydrolase family protein [Aliifodinibius sp. S!AR15-10]|uniref:alpha/beta hydrolase n=1 Tax=Aliifodinibius sp. S!AR15-10 TaxID=2950437 RepID=UPI00285F51C9|nr:alpha/beta-hydrolase family protein [Aliifodinibius sp. S!AR15-10]MDR8390027.1 alpha/beta-hydrolase family protein [Aliifodinibius sp. S!AR15-10]
MLFKQNISPIGLLLGTLFFALSLTPSLLPRTNVIQGLISGLALTSGYGLGVLIRWNWSFFELPIPTKKTQKILIYITGGICLIITTVFLWQATGWQNSLRGMMGMEKTAAMRPIVIFLITVGLFLILLMLGRVFRCIFHRLSEWLQRYVPRRISNAIGLVATFIIFGLAANGVLFTLILEGADATYKQWDRQIQPDLGQPSDSLKAGSEASLLDWDKMGRQGREFLSQSPDTTDLKRFTDQPVRQPIRVYAGMLEGSLEERAELALQELKRVNAFERSVMILATPTGSGWVDVAAIDPVEYLYRGDIATVSAQYSYLPSALSLLLEGEYGSEMARILFQKVYRYWSELPEDERPKLYLQGLSLGALNSDKSFDLFDIIDDPFHGALWSGPPFRSETWQRVTEERRPDSPIWLPQFRDGSVVRFANSNGGLSKGNAGWGGFRIAYLQYASDPIVFFDPHSWLREPEWMQRPRGPSVNEQMEWYPVVTTLQLVADMLLSTEAPKGYGHEYASSDYLQSWLELTEPKNWSNEELDRLRSFFDERGARK